MSATEEQNPSPLTKSWYEAFGGRHTATAFKSHVIPLLLSVLIWHLYAHPLAAFDCQFKYDARLLLVWPFNAIYFDQLAGSDYSPSQICWLYAVTSTTSAIWLCWLVWRIGFEIFRPNVIYVTNGTKILLGRILGAQTMWILAIILCVWVSAQGFSADNRVYGLSLKHNMSVNAFKIVFLFEPYLFFFAGLVVEFASLFLRYLFLGIEHHLAKSPPAS
jgi:hypothetical protein